MITGSVSPSRQDERAKQDERVKWLCRHVALWRGFPTRRSEMTDEHWQHQHSIVNAMKKEGLFSGSTYWMDVNLCTLIRLATAHVRAEKERQCGVGGPPHLGK